MKSNVADNNFYKVSENVAPTRYYTPRTYLNMNLITDVKTLQPRVLIHVINQLRMWCHTRNKVY